MKINQSGIICKKDFNLTIKDHPKKNMNNIKIIENPVFI